MSNRVINKLELIFTIKTFKNAKTPPKFSLTAVYKAALVPMFPRIGQEFVPLQYIMNIRLKRLQTLKKYPPVKREDFIFGHSLYVTGCAQMRCLLACQQCICYLLPINGPCGALLHFRYPINPETLILGGMLTSYFFQPRDYRVVFVVQKSTRKFGCFEFLSGVERAVVRSRAERCDEPWRAE